MMLDVVLLALLPQLAFFATCHRAAIASVGSFSRQHARTSSLLVIPDSFGPTALLTFADHCPGIWNVAPLAVVALETPSSTQGQ